MHAPSLRSPHVFAYLLTLTSLAAAQPAAAPAAVRGKVSEVIVYRGEALVTRTIETGAATGLREIVVGDLPDQVQPASIYAEGGDGVEVRSVSYRIRPVDEDVREEVRKLDEQIRGVQDRIAAAERRRQTLAEQKQYMERLGNFTADTSKTELGKGVLNAETLQKLTLFQFEQAQKIADEELKLNIELRGLQEQASTLQRQRQQVASTSAKVAREALVFVNVTQANAPLKLRYLVGSATWTPSYNVRADSARKQVTIEYLASVQQMSGEDWSNVAMTLSTATPSLVAKAPQLAPMTIALTPAAVGAKAGPAGEVSRQLREADYAANVDRLKVQRQELERLRVSNVVGGFLMQNDAPQQQAQMAAAAPMSAPAPIDLDQDLNRAADSLQLLELITAQKIARDPAGKSKELGRSADEGLSVSYQLTSATSLPSRSDRQLIRIAALPMKAEFYKIATPVLTQYVYNEARLTNDSSTVLLAGPVATYVDNQFVGQGATPSVSVGESFTLGLGIDSSLRVSRELVEKTETTQGGNTLADFTYRITLENFSAQPATVRVLDRLPAAQESQVKVSLTRADVEPVKEARDTGRARTGVLRWNLEAPAQATGDSAKALEYQFRLEYDRQMSIAGLTPRK